MNETFLGYIWDRAKFFVWYFERFVLLNGSSRILCTQSRVSSGQQIRDSRVGTRKITREQLCWVT